MPITLTAVQADKLAQLARELGTIEPHQVSDASDVYVAPARGENRYLVSDRGDADPIEVGSQRGAD